MSGKPTSPYSSPASSHPIIISADTWKNTKTCTSTRCEGFHRLANGKAWCNFFFKAIEEQAHKNIQVAESIKQLYEEMKSIFADTLSSKWSVNALDFIFANPILRNNRLTSVSGNPAQTASRFTLLLLCTSP